MKRLSFINQFKIEFLLPFTGCRKVLGKMPESSSEKYSDLTLAFNEVLIKTKEHELSLF